LSVTTLYAQNATTIPGTSACPKPLAKPFSAEVQKSSAKFYNACVENIAQRAIEAKKIEDAHEVLVGAILNQKTRSVALADAELKYLGAHMEANSKSLSLIHLGTTASLDYFDSLTARLKQRRGRSRLVKIARTVTLQTAAEKKTDREIERSYHLWQEAMLAATPTSKTDETLYRIARAEIKRREAVELEEFNNLMKQFKRLEKL
jgi:hypothetical protein